MRASVRMSGMIVLVFGEILYRADLMSAERHGGGHQSLHGQREDDQRHEQLFQKTFHNRHSIAEDSIAQPRGARAMLNGHPGHGR